MIMIDFPANILKILKRYRLRIPVAYYVISILETDILNSLLQHAFRKALSRACPGFPVQLE